MPRMTFLVLREAPFDRAPENPQWVTPRREALTPDPQRATSSIPHFVYAHLSIAYRYRKECAHSKCGIVFFSFCCIFTYYTTRPFKTSNTHILVSLGLLVLKTLFYTRNLP